MKRLHDPAKPILPADCWTKSEYARHIQKSPAWVEKLIEKGKLVVVQMNGVEMVKFPAAKQSN